LACSSSASFEKADLSSDGVAEATAWIEKEQQTFVYRF